MQDVPVWIQLLAVILGVLAVKYAVGAIFCNDDEDEGEDSMIKSSGSISIMGEESVTINVPFDAECADVCFTDDGPIANPNCIPPIPDQVEIDICDDDCEEGTNIAISWNVSSQRSIKWTVSGDE